MVKGKRPIGVDENTKRLLTELGEEIIEKLGDQFFEVDGTPTATVKYPDGSFKKKPLMAGWNFKLEYAYVGTRGKLILGLSPEDAQEYAFAEMDAKELDTVFPMVGPAVGPLFSVEGERLPFIIDTIIHKRAIEEANRTKNEQARAETAYEENDGYGIF